MKVVFFLLFFLILGWSDVKVAIAANLNFVMPKLIESFHQEFPNIKISTTIGSSGKLAAQIINGADYDLYLSANMAYPKKLEQKGIGYTRTLCYAVGELVVVSKKPIHSLKDLLLFDRIAIANPNTAPYGMAAKEVLVKTRLFEKMKNKLIYGESVAQTVSYAMHGADAAFIPKSTLFSPFFPKMYHFGVDKKLYGDIKQGMLLLNKRDESEKFFIFLFSQKATKIFKQYGYRICD